MYSHGITFGGHPVMAAIALKNIEIMKRERIVEHVAEQAGRLPRDACAAARPADRRRPARDGLLLRARARQGQGDARDLLGRGVRDAPAGLPLPAPLRARASSAAPTTAAIRWCRSRRRSSRTRPSSTRSPASSATRLPRPRSGCLRASPGVEMRAMVLDAHGEKLRARRPSRARSGSGSGTRRGGCLRRLPHGPARRRRRAARPEASARPRTPGRRSGRRGRRTLRARAERWASPGSAGRTARAATAARAAKTSATTRASPATSSTGAMRSTRWRTSASASRCPRATRTFMQRRSSAPG